MGPPIAHWKPRHLHYKPCKYVEAGKSRSKHVEDLFQNTELRAEQQCPLLKIHSTVFMCKYDLLGRGAPVEFQLPA